MLMSTAGLFAAESSIDLLPAAAATKAKVGSFPQEKRPKALVFDLFGTSTDWRSSVIREGEELGRRKGVKVDWGAFADAWRAGYLPIMERVRSGEIPWAKIDHLHRLILDQLIVRFNIHGLTEVETDALNRVWHRLRPWPDVVEGLNRLRSRYVVCALSNGNMSLMVNLSRHASLSWDCILSAELSGRFFKPDMEVYRMASTLLDLPPADIMMVTTHDEDMRGALKAGFRVAYVHRPLEYGPGVKAPFAHAGQASVVADDFLDLATQLGS